MITSEQAGSKKPDAGIFNYALKQAKALPEESLMIGDDLDVDIIGAHAVGMDTIFLTLYIRIHLHFHRLIALILFQTSSLLLTV